MSTFNSPQFNQYAWNGGVGVLTYTPPKFAGRICVTASMANYRITLTAQAGCMQAKIVHLKDYTIGDDQPVDFTFTSWPSPQVLSKAYFTIKESLDDADADALIQKEITSTASSQGQITTTGSSGGTAIGYFIITKDDYGDIVPGRDYYFDIQPINDSGSLYTPIAGWITFKQGATRKTS